MATTLLTNTPAGTDGAPITSANKATTTNTPDAFDTVTYGTGASAAIATVSGWKVITYTSTSGNSTHGYSGSLGGSISDFAFLTEFICPASAPSAVCTIVKGYTDAAYTTGAWLVAISTGLQIRVDTGSGTAGTLTSFTLSPGGKYTVRGRVVAGTSAEVRLYDSTGAEVAAGTYASANFGATQSVRKGLGNGSVVSPLSMRTFKVGTGPGLIDAASVVQVSAGSDQSIYNGSSATLAATIAAGTGSGTVAYSWVKSSGPAGSFSAATSATTNFTPSTAGTYVLTVTATDASGSDSDSVTVTVTAAPTSVVPVAVNASTGFTASAGTVLSATSDGNDATYARTTDNPTALVYDATLGSLSAPAAGVDFVVRVKCRKNTASSGTIVGKLYEGATLRSTTSAVTIPNTAANVDLTFPAADLTAIASSAWTSGIRFTATVTAAA